MGGTTKGSVLIDSGVTTAISTPAADAAGAHHLVFGGKTSVNAKMVRLRGGRPRGTRLRAEVPFGHRGAQIFIGGLRCHGLRLRLGQIADDGLVDRKQRLGST